MTLLAFHGRLAITVFLFALGLGLWGLILYFRKQGPNGSYFGGLLIGEVLFIAQGVIGAILYFSGLPLNKPVHVLYGLLAVFSIPAAYLYTKGATTRRESLIYGIIGLFLFGVALRAISTAR